MARVQLGPVVSDLRGKVGGSIFQRTAHGLALRPYHAPVNPRTTSQSPNKSAIAELQTAWQSLTDTQRNAWKAWAEYQNLLVGQFVHAAQTGQQSFVQLNRYRLLVGDAIIADPVFTPYSLPSSVMILSNVIGTFGAAFSNQVESDDYRPIIMLSLPLTPARNARPAGVRYILPEANPSETDWTLTSPYQSIFGVVPATGTRLWARYALQQRDNGTLSNFTSGVLEVE